MWRQYTREQAAKPRVTLISMAVVFLGTVALAQWTVSRKNGIHDGWPFRYTLPATFTWSELRSRELSSLVEYSEKTRAFYGSSSSFGDCTLIIGFSEDAVDESPLERFSTGLQLMSGSAETIKIGPLDAVMTTYSGIDAGTSLVRATAHNGHNMTIELVMFGEIASKRLGKAMRSFAGSIELTTPSKPSGT